MHSMIYVMAIMIYIVSHVNSNCDAGWYLNDGTWSQCDSSCKTWSNSESCDSWQFYMFQESTSGLWQFWDYGEYFDQSTVQCRNCNGSCLGFWSYQLSCYECPENQMIDTDTLQCVSTWDYPKFIFESADLSFPLVWRGNEIYVNSRSDSLLELGTLDHPYRTTKAAFTELVNHFSNHNASVTIYLAEEQTFYIEDGTTFILNITNVSITSYSVDSKTSNKAKLIPTQIFQSTHSKKTMLNLLSNANMKLEDKINQGIYSDSENLALNTNQATILVLRSNLHIDKIDFEREYIDYGKETLLFNPVYLQDKTFELTNSDINVTGIILNSVDPLHGHFENIIIDSYALRDGFIFNIEWNYPEAIITSKIYFNNLKVITTTDRTFFGSPNIISHQGPSNISVYNSDFTEYYTSYSDLQGTVYFYNSGVWDPSDELNQIVLMDNTTTSLMKTAQAYTRLNLIAIFRPVSSHRKQLNYFYNQKYMNFENSRLGKLFLFSGSQDELYLINCQVANIASEIDRSIWLYRYDIIYIENLSYENVTDVDTNFMRITDTSGQNITLKNIMVKNVTGSASDITDLILFSSMSTSINVIDWLYVSNVYLSGRSIFKQDAHLDQFEIKNSFFESIQISTSDYIISMLNVKSLNFTNNTFSDITLIDEVSTGGAILLLGNLDLSSSDDIVMSGITINDWEISFVDFTGFINSPSSTKFINITDLNYENGYFIDSRAFISTSGVELDADLIIYMSNMIFSNITFDKRGELLEFKHHIPNQVIITNSEFRELKNAKIIIESSDSDLQTRVQINNSMFDNIEDGFDSFIDNKGGELEIHNWSFTNIVSFSEGAVINSERRQTITFITYSDFVNNTALQGGVFNIKEESLIKCYNCVFATNFASVSGVARVIDNGYYEIYNSEIYFNYASQSPISEFFDSAFLSVIDNTIIYLNYVLTYDEILNEFNSSCDRLWFVPVSYREYTIRSRLSYFMVTSSPLFQIISASLSIQNSSQISQQKSLLNMFLSNVIISNSSFSGILLDESAIKVTSSTLNVSNTIFIGFITTLPVDIMFVSLDSMLAINSLSLIGSEMSLFTSRSTNLEVNNLVMDSVSVNSYAIKIYSCQPVSLNQISLVNMSSSVKREILIDDSKEVSINGIHTSGIYEHILYISNSYVTSMTNLVMLNWLRAAHIVNSNITSITNSNFISNGNITLNHGGAIYIIDSIVTIQSTVFTNNTADRGGAIDFSCTSASQWNLVLINNTFIENRAIRQGGAINYDYTRPEFDNITYLTNTAPYGPNIASYPVKIMRTDSNQDYISIENVGSGVVLDQTLTLALYDYDNQIMNRDSVNKVSILAIDTQVSSTSGANTGLLHNGIVSFGTLRFIARPGTPSILYKAFCKAIDYDKIFDAFGFNISENNIDINFRYWKPGEIITEDETCQECNAGTYSLTWNSTVCKNCIDNAVCRGGTQIEVNSEYWRRTPNSTLIVEWLSPYACNGGYQLDNQNPVKWAAGYEGNLWSDWQVTEGKKYEKVGSNVWGECPDPILNAFRFTLFGTIIFILFMLIIVINVRKKRESEISTLLRIFTNYLQLLTTSLSFNINYPDIFSDIFHYASKIGLSTESMLSFDCFINNSEIKGPFPSSSIYKLFLIALSPIILFLVVALIWVMIYMINSNWVPDLKRNLVISFISIMFLLHPGLAASSLSIFQCVTIDEGISKVVIDTKMDCLSSEHILWCFVIGFPILVIWVTITPIIGLILLSRNIKKDDDNRIKQFMLVLYQGLKSQRFYWEFVNTLRKVLILMSYALLITLPPAYRILVAVIILMLTLRIQVILSPYKDHDNNNAEILQLLAWTMVLYSGLIFTSEEEQQTFINSIILLFVLFLNLWFIIKWSYLFIKWMSERYSVFERVLMIIHIVTCRKEVLSGNY